MLCEIFHLQSVAKDGLTKKAKRDCKCIKYVLPSLMCVQYEGLCDQLQHGTYGSNAEPAYRQLSLDVARLWLKHAPHTPEGAKRAGS